MIRTLNESMFRTDNEDIEVILKNFDNYVNRIDRTLYNQPCPEDDSSAISLPVAELTADLFSECQFGKSLKRLHSTDIIEISQFMTSCSVIVSLVYLERLKEINPDFLLKHSPDHIFIISVIIANKFLYDSSCDRSDLIQSILDNSDLSFDELVKLEKVFLNAIDWKVFVSTEHFWSQLDTFEKSLALKQGLSRGWFTYTELKKQLNFEEFQCVIRYILAASVCILAVYVASLVTISITLNMISYRVTMTKEHHAANISNGVIFKKFYQRCNLTKLDSSLSFLMIEKTIDECQKRYPMFNLEFSYILKQFNNIRNSKK